MTTTINNRLSSAENDINRILESLQEAITVDSASKHVSILDSEAEQILFRIKSLEQKIESLKYKWQQAYKRVNS